MASIIPLVYLSSGSHVRRHLGFFWYLRLTASVTFSSCGIKSSFVVVGDWAIWAGKLVTVCVLGRVATIGRGGFPVMCSVRGGDD